MRVHAIDSANNPVPGVEIMPVAVLKKGKLSSVNFGDSFKVRTDAQGIATFDWLPADMQHRANFLVGTRSYSRLILPGLDPDAPGFELTTPCSQGHDDLGQGYPARRIACGRYPRHRRGL